MGLLGSAPQSLPSGVEGLCSGFGTANLSLHSMPSMKIEASMFSAMFS